METDKMGAVTTADSTADSTDARRRLAEIVRARRLELGLSVRAAAAQTGVARDTWIGLEEATRRTAETNYAGIEKTLRWAPGSILAVLGGGEPSVARSVRVEFGATPIDVDVIPVLHTTGSGSWVSATRDHPADAALIKIMRSPDLTDQQKARIVRSLIADQERYAEQRAAELIEQARGEQG